MKEQESRRALAMSVEEAGGRLGYHDHPGPGGNGRGGFDNSLDISQIEREAAEGQEVNYFLHKKTWHLLSIFTDWRQTDLFHAD